MTVASVPTHTLKGAGLAWAMALALGLDVQVGKFAKFGPASLFTSRHVYLWPRVGQLKYDPLNDLRTLEAVIETCRIQLLRRTPEEEAELAHPDPRFNWRAQMSLGDRHYTAHGETFGEAALRCFLMPRLGEQANIPKELL